jgi:hypothetical protein
VTTPDTRDLDLYKLGAELADRVSARRAAANSYFLTVQTTLIAIVGLVSPRVTTDSTNVRLVVTAAGVMLSVCWWMTLRSYRELNSAKFDILHRIEERLPVRLFAEEWEILQSRPSSLFRPRYSELGRNERIVPWIFAVLWIGLFLARLCS